MPMKQKPNPKHMISICEYCAAIDICPKKDFTKVSCSDEIYEKYNKLVKESNNGNESMPLVR